MRAAVILLTVVTAALLQTALFPHLAIAGFRPDLLILVTAGFALREGPLTGTVVGFVAGLTNDLLLVETATGAYTVILVVAGYTIGVARQYVPSGAVFAPLLVAFVSGAAVTGAYAIFARLLGDPRFTWELTLEATILVALYNTLLAPATFAALNVVSERFPTERAAAVT
jgi:rod shape-determining protein MreD